MRTSARATPRIRGWTWAKTWDAEEFSWQGLGASWTHIDGGGLNYWLTDLYKVFRHYCCSGKANEWQNGHRHPYWTS